METSGKIMLKVFFVDIFDDVLKKFLVESRKVFALGAVHKGRLAAFFMERSNPSPQP
jgi:hypothetical protein